MDQVSITSAYMWALVSMAVCFFIAVIIANAVLYKPGNPGTATRRIWFWVFCIVSCIVGYLINYVVGSNIDVPSTQSKYLMHSGIAAGISCVLYIGVGFLVSKLFPNKKVGTWF